MAKTNITEVNKLILESATIKVKKYLLEAKQDKIISQLREMYNEDQLEELFGKLGGGIGALANKAGGAISNKFASSTQAVKNKIAQAGATVGNVANNVKQGVTNAANQISQTYQQGAQAAEEKAKQQQAAKVGANIADLIAKKNVLQAQYQQLTGRFYNPKVTNE